MSTLYKDIKMGTEVEYWLNIPDKKHVRKKGDDEYFPESRNHGFGKVLFTGAHFVTIQLADGRKETISRVDILLNNSQVREVERKRK